MIDIPLYYDFASTICYVTHRVMQRKAAELDGLGVSLVWKPIDLARITGWPRGADVEGPRRENALRVAAEFSIAALMPARWLDSRALHAVTLDLRGTTREPTWRERVWTAVYDEGRKVDEPGELERLGADLGIDTARLASEAGLARVDAETRLAYEAGVGGVPTFDLAGWFLCGLQDDETTRRILERFVAKQRDREAAG